MDNLMFQVSLTRKRKHKPLLGNQQKRQRLGAIGADVGKEDFFPSQEKFLLVVDGSYGPFSSSVVPFI